MVRWPRTADCDQASAQAAGSRGRATFSARCPAATTRAHLSRLFPRSATKWITAQTPVVETAAARTGTDSGSAGAVLLRRIGSNISTIRWINCGMPCPVTAEIATASRHSSPRDPLAGFARAGHVHLGDDQQLGPVGQGRAVLGELVADRPVVVDRVGAVERHGLDQVNQDGRPLDVAEELVAQPVPGVRALDQARGCRPRRSCAPQATTVPRLGYLVVNG